MIELGKLQTLEVFRMKSFGVYLGEHGLGDNTVLLPQKQVPEGTGVGDLIDVFIYKDSEDRLIATTAVPRLQVGEAALLNVKEVSRIGAFLDMGLEKDLLLPFKEQNREVKPGEQCLVALYVDKSGRLAATMNVYSYMNEKSPYQKDDRVTGTIYEIHDTLGAFVAVDNKYYGLIPQKELYGQYRIGQAVEARVTKVREDGKLDLSPREKGYLQMETDAQAVMRALEESDGVLPFTDKADPEIIKGRFHISKNAFKRAIGRLLREGKIRITDNTIEKI